MYNIYPYIHHNPIIHNANIMRSVVIVIEKVFITFKIMIKYTETSHRCRDIETIKLV